MTACVVGVALIMGIMFYALEPGNVFTYSPWHHDDYRALHQKFDYELDFEAARPIAEYVSRWLTNAGPWTFYLGLHVLLAADLALFFLLALDILGGERLSRPAIMAALVFGTIVVCGSPDSPAIVKFAGNIDSLTSLFFGILSVLFLSKARKRGEVSAVAISALMFVLSILAKEHTLLFLGAAALWKGIPALKSNGSLAFKSSLIVAALVSLGILAFLLSPASTGSGPMLQLSPGLNDWAARIRYLGWPSPYYQRALLAFLALCAAHVAATRRFAALGAATLFAALLAPYALLDTERVSGHSRFNFSPFAVYCAFIMAAQLAQWIHDRGWIPRPWIRLERVVHAAVWIGFAAVLWRAARPERHDILVWHNNVQSISRKVLDRITELQPVLKRRTEIHVTGADGTINPFFWLEGVMHVNREILGAPVKWVVHYDPQSELARTLQTYQWARENPAITYTALDPGDSRQWRPRIEIDASFQTTLIDSSE